MGRVEWAMMHVKELHGGKDITARKTIEWGNVEKLQNGDRKIRYKFLRHDLEQRRVRHEHDVHV